MAASLNTDTTLRVELEQCQFTKEARYSISLQLSLPGAVAVQERTEVAASSTQPSFKPSSFQFRLPAGLPLVGSPPVELKLSAVTPELDSAAAEGTVPQGVTTAMGEAMVELGDTLRELQQNNGPASGKPVVRELQLTQGGESTGTLRVQFRLVDAMPQRAPLPSEAETRMQGRPGGAMDASVELAHKQALIDRLLDDVDKRANAVARCGQEIMELRALNKHQEQELQAQRAAAVGRERAIERLADDAANVDNIDMVELQRRHRLLAAAYRADRKRIEQLQALNQQYATSLSTQEQLQSAYATLKEAHKQQASQMLRLQDEAKKVAKYRHTARQQEQIITRLEQLMQASLKDAKGARAQAGEVHELRGQLSVAKEELAQNRDVPMQVTEEQVKLLMRAERGERRAAAVEEEMTEMARRTAREIASLKLRLAEKDAQLMGGFGSSANLMLGELSDGGGSHSGSAAPSPMGRNQSGSFSGRSVRLPPRHPSRGGLGGSSGRLSPRLDPLEQAQPEPPPPVPVLPPPAAADAPAVAA